MPCPTNLEGVAPDFYALSPGFTTPVSIGSLCSRTPTILFRSYAESGDSPFAFINVKSMQSGFMDRSVWERYVAQHQAAGTRDLETRTH